MAMPGRLQRILAAFRRDSGRSTKPTGNDSWSPDDLAECVWDGPWRTGWDVVPAAMRRGHVSIVREVLLTTDGNGRPALYLGFARWPGALFNACAFRKLTPRADAADAADAAFVAGLKHCGVPAQSPALPIAARLKRIFS